MFIPNFFIAFVFFKNSVTSAELVNSQYNESIKESLSSFGFSSSSYSESEIIRFSNYIKLLLHSYY